MNYSGQDDNLSGQDAAGAGSMPAAESIPGAGGAQDAPYAGGQDSPGIPDAQYTGDAPDAQYAGDGQEAPDIPDAQYAGDAQDAAITGDATETSDAQDAAIAGSDETKYESARKREPTGIDTNDETQNAAGTRMELYDWLQCIVTAIICGIFIFVFVGRTIGVEGDSMMNTLHYYDRVIMSNLFYTPKNGDIIIFKSPSEAFGDTPLVKRVIAVEDQTVRINFDTGEVTVDGVVQNEPYIRDLTHRRLDFPGEVTVKKGHVFVMGDNRNESSDSRDDRIGQVDTRYILGKVLFIAIPGADSEGNRDWGRFGFVH